MTRPADDVSTRRAIDALRDSAEDRQLSDRPVLTPTTDGEPMICDDREASTHAVEHHRP